MLATTGLLTVDHVGDTLIVTPTTDPSELTYQQMGPAAGYVLSILDDPSVRNVVVDFHRTDYFGSSALGFFIRLWKRVTERNGRMAFCNVSDNEKDILQITKLNRTWAVAGSRTEAMRMVHK